MSLIFHLDLDTFFVSVERILDPSLVGKPVIVGGQPGGRGVVSACSYETRKFGVRSGMPTNRAYKLCPQAIFVRGSHGEYSRYSNMVREILIKYPPMIQQASVDEFYMDFTGCEKIYGNPMLLAERLLQEIYDKVKLPGSIGIGSNKTIAKICSDFNKPRGITYVAPGMEKDFLAPLPAETMPGVGKVFIEELHARGIYTIGDIARMPAEYFASVFGKGGLDIWEKANGKGTEYISEGEERKSISSEQTFRSDISSPAEIEAIMFGLVAKISQKIRDEGSMATNIHIKLRYADFSTITVQKQVIPTNDDKFVYTTAVDLFRKAYTRRVGVRLIGVGMSGFVEYHEQHSLFESTEDKRTKMINAINQIRGKYGFESINIGLLH
ncbi:MAG: DNA polymerase IV [Ignavibacteriales bacterium]|nr:DNA polymerase IV [Ignavibacteriales bacterium]